MANFLSPTQQAKIAEALDKKIGIPFVSNNKERDIFLKLAKVIDSAVEARVPDELLAGLNTPGIQIETIVADALKENLVPLLSDVISFPFLPGTIKRKILSFVVELLVDVMASQTTLDEKIEAFLAEG